MQNYITCAALVISEDGKILLKRDPVRGWELPGGNLDEGESLSQCAIREVKEETGIDVEIVKFSGITHEVKNQVLIAFWIARPIGGQLETCSESLEVGFFEVQEGLALVERDDFREEIVKCLYANEHPFYIAN